MSLTTLNLKRQVSKSHNEIDNKINLNSEAMGHNKCTLPNTTNKNAHLKKDNINPSRGILFKTRVKSTVSSQIKGRGWRSIPCGIDSWRDMRPGGVRG
jgi:hypothetical protein